MDEESAIAAAGLIVMAVILILAAVFVFTLMVWGS